MKKLALLLFLLSTFCFGQKERVQIKGSIQTTAEEPVEGITIFNLNNLEGTITNESGVFYINVMEGDVLNFDAIQFEPFRLTVGSETIKSKTATLTLNEGVNQLEEVVIQENLMIVPVKRDVEIKPVLEDVDPEKLAVRANDRMENTFSDRIRQPEEYPVEQLAQRQSELRYSCFNLVGLLGSLLINESLRNLDLSGEPKEVKEEFNAITLKNKFSTEYLVDFIDIKEENLYEFMYFAVDNGLDEEMMQPDKELDLLQFLSEQAVVFKERKGEQAIEKKQ